MEYKQREETVENGNWGTIYQHNTRLGEGLQVGKIVTFHVADGIAAYEIEDVSSDISHVEYRAEFSTGGYQSQAVTDDGRIFTETLEKACKRIDFSLEINPNPR